MRGVFGKGEGMARSTLRNGRSIRLALALGVLAIVAGCGGADTPPGSSGTQAQEPPQKKEDPSDLIAVRVASVETAPISSLYATSSTLRADKQATVIARTQGVIRRLRVEEGDVVTAEQVLAVLEDDEQRIEVDRTRTALQIEEQEYLRAKKLHGEELLSFEDFEAARREFEDARHGAARADLELERTEVRAPFSGIVVRRHLDPGATVSDGTAVYDLADVTPLYTDVNVPERHVARLAPGQIVRLHADSSGETVVARIERIAPSVDVASGTVKVTLAVEEKARLRPGAFVRVNIITDTHSGAMVVPRAALVAEGSRWHLFRMDGEDDRVAQVDVVLGYEEGDRVEIAKVVDTDDRLAAGDRVVVVGASALTDGARVVVLDGDDGDAETDEAETETQTEGTAGASA